MAAPTLAEVEDFAASWSDEGVPAPQVAPTTLPAPQGPVAPEDVQSFAASWGEPKQLEQAQAPITTPPNPALQGMGMWAQQAQAGPAALAQHEAETIAANQTPGIPLDVQSGAGALTRLKLGAERNRMQQLNLLREQYGEDAVRMDKQGRWIVQTQDRETGKPKDVLVDEEAMTVKDLLDVAHKFPAAALSFLATKGAPAGSIFKTALMGALGWAGGDAAVDVASRVGRADIEPGEIVTERGKQILQDIAVGYGLGKGINAMGTLGRLLRMASNETPALLSEGASAAARARVEEGRQAVKAATGIRLEPTIGELTGNPIIQRLEAFFSNIPLARGFILKNIERRIANERAIQTELMRMAGGGPADVPDATRLGEAVIAAVGGKLQGLTQQAGELAGTVRREAASALTEPLEQISGAPLSSTSFGQRMIKRGEAQLQSFKNRATELWDRIRAFPEANQPAFNMTPIKRDARKMLDELVKTEEGEVAKGLAPAGVSPTLSSIENLADDASYFDLVKLRDAVYDRIGSPEPISDKGTRLLKSLGASITKELHTQGPKVFGSRKWADVEIANQFYRENVESFYQKGIVGMLKPRTEAGAIDPEKVAASLLSGGKGSVTTYNTFRDFFEKAGAIKDMNRMLRDQLIDAGTDRMTGLVKLEDFTAGLARMEPELVQEIYGVSKKELLTDAQRAQQGLRVIAGKGKALPERGGGTQAEIEADAFKEALATGKVKSGVLKALATTTDEIQRAYSKELTKALGMGDTRLIEAAPERFVRDFLLNPATSERAAQNAMQHLMATGDDLLVGDVRRLYLADLFKAGAAGAKGDVQQLVSMQTGSPLRNLDPQKLAVIMEDTGVQKRMDLILGPDVAKAVREFGIALSGQPGRDAAATATGSFAGGTYTHALIQALGGKVGALAALPDLAKYRLLSYLITSPDSIKTLRTVANLVPADFTALAKTMALSPEFAHAIASDSTTPEEAAEVTRAIQQWATTPESNAPPQR